MSILQPPHFFRHTPAHLLSAVCAPDALRSLLPPNQQHARRQQQATKITMVATRNHPTDFQDGSSPTKRPTRTSSAASPSLTKPAAAAGASNALTPSRGPGRPPNRKSAAWSHTPSNLTLIWLAISLPLVIWDTGYVMLRPHSMPGGKWNYPIWSAYKLYSEVDKVYGWEAIETNNGWTAAQGTGNVIETALYFLYLYIVYNCGQQEPVQGRGAPDKSVMGQLRGLSESRTVSGSYAAYAVLIGFTTAVMTLWKTALYWLIEYFNGYASIGHNNLFNLLFVFIIPNGAWLVLPTYMIYVFGLELLQGLETAAGSNKTK